MLGYHEVSLNIFFPELLDVFFYFFLFRFDDIYLWIIVEVIFFGRIALMFERIVFDWNDLKFLKLRNDGRAT